MVGLEETGLKGEGFLVEETGLKGEGFLVEDIEDTDDDSPLDDIADRIPESEKGGCDDGTEEVVSSPPVAWMTGIK